MKKHWLRLDGVVACWLLLGIGSLFTTTAICENVDGTNQRRLNTLEKLVLSARYQEAYEYGKKLESYWEGDEQFDYSFGLSALENGDFDKAVFSLQRAQLSNPSQKRYRLELARAYFYSKNYDASEVEFKQVLDTDPPTSVRQNIQKFLDRIDRLRNRLETSYSGLVEVLGGYDSNVNSGPIFRSIPGEQLTFNQNIQLDDDSREQGSGFYGVLLSGGIIHPINQRNLIDARVTGIARDNPDEPDFDMDAVFVDAGYAHRFHETQRVRFGGRYQRSFLAGSGFFTSPAVSIGWNQTLESGWSFGSRLQYSQFRYDGATSTNDPDINQYFLQGTLFAPPARSKIGAIIHYGDDRAKDSEFDYNSKYFYGVQVEQSWLFNRFSLGWNTAFNERRFKDERPGISRSRRDSSAKIAFNLRASLSKNISLRNLYSYTFNYSNLNFYRHRRFKVELALQMNF